MHSDRGTDGNRKGDCVRVANRSRSDEGVHGRGTWVHGVRREDVARYSVVPGRVANESGIKLAGEGASGLEWC